MLASPVDRASMLPGFDCEPGIADCLAEHFNLSVVPVHHLDVAFIMTRAMRPLPSTKGCTSLTRVIMNAALW
jgi:hypothetical protein